MKIKSQKDFWAGLMFIVLGLAFAVGALNYSFGSSARPGPGYFPFGLGILLALLGGWVLFDGLAIDTRDGEPLGRWAWRPLLVIAGAVALFGWALPHLGLALALPLLVVTVSMAGDEFRWTDALVNAAVLTFGSWLVFVKGLALVIPLWPPSLAG